MSIQDGTWHNEYPEDVLNGYSIVDKRRDATVLELLEIAAMLEESGRITEDFENAMESDGPGVDFCPAYDPWGYPASMEMA